MLDKEHIALLSLKLTKDRYNEELISQLELAIGTPEELNYDACITEGLIVLLATGSAQLLAEAIALHKAQHLE